MAGDDRGAAAVEYGLISSLVFVAVVSAIATFGGKTTSLIDGVSQVISAFLP